MNRILTKLCVGFFLITVGSGLGLQSFRHGLRPTNPTLGPRLAIATVYDGVFTAESTIAMRSALVAADIAGGIKIDETRIIDRADKTLSRGLVAQAIESCVDELGDSSRFIEWWWRDEVYF